MISYTYKIFFFTFLFLITGQFSCSTVNSNNENLQTRLEIERVWQYLKVYSIYTDRVPNHSELYKFSSPQELVASINDTMYDHIEKYSWYVGNYSFGCDQKSDYASSNLKTKKNNSGSVSWNLLTDSTLYVRISSFIRDSYLDTSTYKELSALAKTTKNIPYIILDLIDNLGGNLYACTASVDLFLPKNIKYLKTTWRKDIYQTGDTGTVTDFWITRRTGDAWENKKVAILINNYTASASEILTVALKTGLKKNCRLFGQQSYGKAIGQYVFCFSSSSNGQLITTGFKFSPIENSIPQYHEKGINPDVEAPLKDIINIAGKWLEKDFAPNYYYASQPTIKDSNDIKQRLAKSCYKKILYDDIIF